MTVQFKSEAKLEVLQTGSKTGLQVTEENVHKRVDDE